MPVTSQWLGASEGKVTEEQLKRMIVEMTCYNRQQWSRETVASVTGGPRGSVQLVLASLSRGPLSGAESRAFVDIDLSGADDPFGPRLAKLREDGRVTKTQRSQSGDLRARLTTEVTHGAESLAPLHGDESPSRIPVPTHK